MSTPNRNGSGGLGEGGCNLSVPRRSPRLVAWNAATPAVQDRLAEGNESDDDIPVLVPKVGMVYPTMLDVEAMYKRYAKSKGFGISRVASSFNVNKERRATKWCCESYGSPEMKSIKKANKLAKNPNQVDDVRKELVNPKKRMSKKCFCGAMVYASINQRKEWVVRSVMLEHNNHQPSPSKVN